MYRPSGVGPDTFVNRVCVAVGKYGVVALFIFIAYLSATTLIEIIEWILT